MTSKQKQSDKFMNIPFMFINADSHWACINMYIRAPRIVASATLVPLRAEQRELLRRLGVRSLSLRRDGKSRLSRSEGTLPVSMSEDGIKLASLHNGQEAVFPSFASCDIML